MPTIQRKHVFFDDAVAFLEFAGNASTATLDALFKNAFTNERDEVVKQLEFAGVISLPDSQGERVLLIEVEGA